MQKIADKYGLSRGSLSKYLTKPGEEFKGVGGKNKNLTPNEEKRIAKTILEKNGGSKLVESRFVRHLIDEEVKIIRQNEPDRIISTEYYHITNFLKRFGFKLSKSDKPFVFECEECNKKFALKKRMVHHKKTMHGFLDI